MPMVVVILGVVCAVVAIGILDIAAVQNGAKASSTEVRLNSLTDSVRMYQIRVGVDPGDLQMLVDGPTDAAAKAKWVEPILDEVPKDAWGNDFLYCGNDGSVSSWMCWQVRDSFSCNRYGCLGKPSNGGK